LKKCMALQCQSLEFDKDAKMDYFRFIRKIEEIKNDESISDLDKVFLIDITKTLFYKHYQK